MSPRTRAVIRASLVVLALGAAAFVASPMGRYLLRAGWEEAGILWKRRPLTELVADSTVSAPLRQRLQLVLDARQFAVDSIGLVAKESFTTYSALARDTLVLVLSASRRDTLAAHTWWFPVVGRFPYKGFFDFAEAQRVAADMRDRGYDTYLRPASAFSTLGWFNDPLLSTTVRQPAEAVVNTVVHELLHNTVFVRGQVVFNESFASFIGAHGAMAFYRSRGDTAAERRARDDWEDDKALAEFWSTTAKAIDSVLAIPGRDSVARIAARDTVYARRRRWLMGDIAPRLRTVDTTRLRALQLDNAALIARRTYASDLALFDALHRRSGGELRRTIEVIRTITKEGGDAFAAVRGYVR
ncbi:MAG: aminopeptidase [Gemmatimonadetes bacterium]|nr:aminopeptidase [Gemmatimonadota bacterium]